MRLPLFLALLALPAFAEGAPDLGPMIGRPGSVARLIEAHRLYQLGQSAHDPVLVFAAARLMQEVTLREVTRTLAEPLPTPPEPEKKPKDKKDKSNVDPAKDGEPLAAPAATAATVVPDPAQSAALPGALTPAAMMAEARNMVPDKDLLRDVIANAETETPPPGPVAQVTSLIQSAGGNTTFSMPLAGGSYGEIGLLRLSPDLTPDHASAGHLSMLVTDAAGNPVCVDASASASALCGIVPKETGTFRITVTNDGTAPAAYLLITN
jgi:hypothetical protein